MYYIMNNALDQPPRNWALDYAQRGWPVFPCHVPYKDGCTCGDPSCPCVGKHPRTPHGSKDATTDKRTIVQWLQRWPGTNLAIATGAPSGFIVLDIDPHRGGAESLAKLEASNTSLPKTIETLTGGGGRHLFFQHPGRHVSNSANQLAPGLDIRGDGGYIIVPPSRHKSGKRYTWKPLCSPDEVSLEPPPSWLLNLLCSVSSRQPSPDSSGSLGEGSRNNALFRMARAMRRAGFEQEAIFAALVVTNATQCLPPLAENEVHKIATSAAKYSPEAFQRLIKRRTAGQREQ